MGKIVRYSMVCLFISLANASNAQKVWNLYEKVIPNNKTNQVQETQEESEGILRIGGITVPTIEGYLPKTGKRPTPAVIIFPGGGYWINAYRHEGTDVAKVFQKMGVAAFVVKYRIPDSATMINPAIGPLQDAQRAIQWVRERANVYRIDVDKIGVMGFSAGGHLAATAGTHFDKAYIENPAGTNLRPDFMVLVYPVVSLVAPYSHSGSATKLLGSNPTKELLNAFSAGQNVNAKTPPTFLVHTTADRGVSPLHSIHFYEALLHHQVPAEMHIYQEGKHGFGLVLPNKNEAWMERCLHWMQTNAWLKVKK